MSNSDKSYERMVYKYNKVSRLLELVTLEFRELRDAIEAVKPEEPKPVEEGSMCPRERGECC